RLLPSGPTAIDMIANAALTIGLSLGLRARMDLVRAIFPFAYAEQNLYRAAKHGLMAELFWPAERAPAPRLRSARELVLELLPVAEGGLIAGGVHPDEARALLAVIEARVQTGRTGAVVQRALVGEHDRDLAAMVERYLGHAAAEQPVHLW
ncbi:MAG TPA: hypothetical protein VI299_06320, partial [Polyangiales bacterium]